MKLKLKPITSVILWAVILMMWTQIAIGGNVRAEDEIYGGSSYAYTTVSDEYDVCDADVYGTSVQSVLDVDDGDTVYYEFHLDYVDLRTGEDNPTATHIFTIAIYYPGRPPSAYQKQYYTHKVQDSGYDIEFEHSVQNVHPPVYNVYISWHASVSCDDCTPDNPDPDSQGAYANYI